MDAQHRRGRRRGVLALARPVAVAVAALLLFGYGLGTGSLWDQDEPRYFQVAREVLGSGDPFTLRYDGQPWFVHPPLFFWLQALAASVLGFTEVAARLWTAVSSAAAVGVTFLLAQGFYGRRTALLASAILATTLQVLVQARLAVFDPTLLAFMLATLYMALVAQSAERPGAYRWAGAWAGLATATKGPIGLLLPAMVLGALWTVRREWWRLRRIPLAAVGLFVLVGLPWYVVETVRHGRAFLETAVGYYLVTRFVGVVENQPGPWWYYIPVLLVGSYPWTALIPSALALHLRRRAELPSQVILLWCGITVAFYSVAGTKLPNYVLPVYPLLAIGIARLWDQALAPSSREAGQLLRRAAFLLPVGPALLVAAIVAFGVVKFPAEMTALRPVMVGTLALMAAGPLVGAGLLLTGRVRAALASLVLTLALFVPVLVHATLPAVERFRPLPRIARAMRAAMAPGDALVLAGPERPSLRFYADRAVVRVTDRAELARALCRLGRTFVVVPAEEDAWVRDALPAAARQQGADGGYRILLVESPAACPGAQRTP